MTPRLLPLSLALVACVCGQAQELIREIHATQGLQRIVFLAAVGDCDRDGIQDLLVTDGPSWYVASGRTGAALGPLFNGSFQRAMPLGDVNGDGEPEFLTISNQAEVRNRFGAILHSTLGNQVALAGDQNSDGVQDFFLPDGIHSGRDGSLIRALQLLAFLAGVDDVNMDGHFDIASTDVSLSNPQTLRVTSGRDGQTIVSVQVPAATFIWETGDLDADGAREITTQTVMGSVGRGVFSARRQQFLTLGWGCPGYYRVGDIDQNGQEEVIGLSMGQYHVCSASMGLVFPGVASPQGAMAAGPVGDVNGDGLPDVAVSTPEGTVRIYGFVRSSFRAFGNGCLGTWGTPRLTAPLLPRAGERFEVVTSNLAPFSGSFLSLGYSNTAWGPIPLPADLTAIGAPSCWVYVSGDSIQPLFTTTGTAIWAITIPRDYGLLRTRIFMQCFPFDARANPLGITASNAGEAYIGG